MRAYLARADGDAVNVLWAAMPEWGRLLCAVGFGAVIGFFVGAFYEIMWDDVSRYGC